MPTTRNYAHPTSEGVRYAEHCPGDGTRYAGFVTPLPCDAEGGSPDTHVLVTILVPFTAAYVVAKRGLLADAFLTEKFLGGRNDPFDRSPMLPGVRGLLVALTGREVQGPTECPDSLR